MRAGLAAALMMVGACGASPSQGTDDASPGDPDGAMQGSGSDAGDTWSVLVERDWQLPGQTEDYFCRRIQVTADTYITGFRAEAPAGTHHAVVTMTPTLDATMSMGDYHCGPEYMDSQMLFSGGVGMDELNFPAGVAIKVPAGWYVNLYLLVDNRTTSPTSGKSGVMIKTTSAAAVQHEADMVFLGNINSSNTIAANSAGTVLGGCPVTGDWHIVGLIPHMHDVAVKQTITTLKPDLSAGPTLLTANYNVGQQHSYPMDVVVPQNYTLKTTCDYVNTTNRARSILDSAYEEQCLTGMYRWPKQTDANADKYSCVTKP